jgi:GDPmannose 4,6-dehydratase
MPSALIIGVASQDGSYLAEFLLSKKYSVIGTTRKTGDDVANIVHITSRITLETADFLDEVSMENLFKKYQPDEVYNLAAFSAPVASWEKSHLTGQITGLGPVIVLDAIRKHSPRSKFFQASSREIFGTVNSKTATENTPVHPENPYAAAKAYAHFMTQVYRDSLGIFACAGILFNHESPRRPSQFVTRKITTAVASKSKLHLWDLGSPRDRGYAKEYVEAMWLMLQNKTPKDYIIATNTLHTIADICQVAYSRVGLNYKDYVVLDPSPAPPSTDSVRGDYSLIQKDLGWSPKTSFKELIELMVDADLKNSS